MEDNVVFKTAVGGFEKRAVLDYIYDMNKQSEDSEKALKEEIAKLKESLEEAEESAQLANENAKSLEREISSLRDNLDVKSEDKEEYASTINNLNEEVANYKKLLQQQQEKTEKFIEENREALEKNEAMAAQQAKLDKASYQLGRVMLDARTDADAIVSSAKEQAQQIAQKAQDDSQQTDADAKQAAEKIISDAQLQAKSELDSAKEQGKQTVAEAESLAETAITIAKERADESILNARNHVSTVVNVTKDVADTSTVQLRELRRETLAIRQAVQDAFQMLQKKADDLDTYIETAQKTVASEQSSVIDDKIAEIPGLDMEQLRKEHKERQSAQRHNVVNGVGGKKLGFNDIRPPEKIVVPENVEPPKSVPAFSLASPAIVRSGLKAPKVASPLHQNVNRQEKSDAEKTEAKPIKPAPMNLASPSITAQASKDEGEQSLPPSLDEPEGTE